MRLRQALEQRRADSPAPGEAAVKLLFDDGSAYPHAGRLLFSEATVDATTGQVTLRGEFPNPTGDLLPGMYVRVLIEQGVEKAAIAVPQQAIQRDAGGNALGLCRQCRKRRRGAPDPRRPRHRRPRRDRPGR